MMLYILAGVVFMIGGYAAYKTKTGGNDVQMYGDDDSGGLSGFVTGCGKKAKKVFSDCM